MMIRGGISCFIFLFFAHLVWAQDPLFSLMFNNRNVLNPALMASQNSAFDADFYFREQAGSVSDGLPIRTFQSVINFSNPSLKVDRIGYGISMLGDKGGTGHIGSTAAHLHFAYLKKLTGRYSKIGAHYIGLGSSLGLGQRRVDWDRFWFGSQFNTTFFYIDREIDPNEPNLNLEASGQSGIYTDLNLGLQWYANLSDQTSLQAGLAVFHLNRANISLTPGMIEQIRRRFVGHFRLAHTFENDLTIKPALIYLQQGASSQLIVGSDIGFTELEFSEVGVEFGVHTRIIRNQQNFGFEALILTINTYYNHFRFGLAYDVTVSGLAKYNNARGAWEFSLGYSFAGQGNQDYQRDEKVFRF